MYYTGLRQPYRFQKLQKISVRHLHFFISCAWLYINLSQSLWETKLFFLFIQYFKFNMIHYLIVKIFLSFSFWYMYYFLFNNKHTFYSNKNVLYLVVLMNISKSIHLILLILNWHLVIYKNCKRVVKKLFKTNIQMKTCYVKLNTCIVKIYRAVKMKYSN